ncbi:MAG TPA: PTS sugar transporter subunit IIC [Clostridiaceae bacterium]|nr:PTS sugar transporter subunit IIC [Clostridiaceae bacterium]HBF77976.1 PTS sugar transporter subunit IIC [Clostridiaceae bacterium]HBG38336.1 PTS sugar transporter subunit IIC [Clostridiaceae bacterium]HBN27842.1 PTS sugar transporter subunit IIC [Clostridiaceae bacterium]HBX47944.1 PTS sugar transporter subunit IIC [Clostridiaceae bacterium]
MANSGVNPEVLAKEIIKDLGGKDNLISAVYCMTRLRIVVADMGKIDKKSIKETEGVLGYAEQGNQAQIILGPGRVTKVAQIVADITGIKLGEANEAEVRKSEINAKNDTAFKRVLKKISNIFIPLIPAFIACGLVMGINNMVIKANPNFANTLIGGIFGIIGGAVFYGLNLFVGVNAAKEFGGSPMLGGTMAAIISMPNLANVKMNGKPFVPGRGGVIAVLLVVAFSSWLEKKIRKIIPDVLDLFVTPLLTVLISGFVALFVLQPIGGIISDAIGKAVSVSIKNGGALTGFILGGTFLPLVMTGLHQGLTPIHADLLKTTGENLLLPILAMAGAGQVGASIAVLVKTKNKRLKKTIASALPVGILGVGEPLIYGVTLPLGKPFIGACIGGAFGGAFNAATQVACLSMGISGLPLALVIKPGKVGYYLLGVLISYVAGFIATYIIGFEDPVE